MTLQEGWTVKFDAITLHIVQQFVASTIQVLCGMTGAGKPLFERIEMVPHPEAGLDHLQPWFGSNVIVSPSRVLTLRIALRVAETPFRRVALDRRVGLPLDGMMPMSVDGTLSGTARVVMGAMLQFETPTAEQLALASGLSLRTFQRRVLEEGTTFSQLLDEVRRNVALAEISAPKARFGPISAALG